MGETKTVTLSPDQAYGARDERMVIEVSLDKLPDGANTGQ